MNKKLFFKLCIFVLIILVSTNFVFSLGITPARRSFNFEKGDSSGKITIINNQHKDVRLAIYTQREYSNNIKLSQYFVEFTSEENSKSISYDLTMPEDLEPGTSKIKIIVLELPENFMPGSSDDSLLSASTAITSEVFIEVPYPGKYIDAKLHANSANSNQQLTFTIPLINKGKQNLNNIYADLIIKGPTNEELARVRTNEISLANLEDGKIAANWLANVNPGSYFVEAVINFDGEQLVLRETFLVGNKNLNIKNILIDKFKLGQIAKVDVIVDSVWNEVIDNVYAELDVIDGSGNSLKKVKTSSVNLPALGTEVLSGYWDTEGMSIGDYDISVKLFYGDKISEKLFQAVINADNIQITDTTNIAGNVIKTDSKEGSLLSVLVIAVIVLIILNVSWLVYLKKKNKGK